MSAHTMPQTFIASIENDPERRKAVVATVQFAHVTEYDPRVPRIRDEAVRVAELSLQRDIFATEQVRRQLAEIEMDLLKESYHPGDSERIREAFAKIRAIKMPALPTPKRHDVIEPVRSLRFMTGVLLSTRGDPGADYREARVHVQIVPMRSTAP